MTIYFDPTQGPFNFIVLQRIHRQDYDGETISFVRTIYADASSTEEAEKEASAMYEDSFKWEHLGTYKLV